MGAAWLVLIVAALAAGLVPGLLVPAAARWPVVARERALLLYAAALLLLQLVAGLNVAGMVFAWMFILVGFAAGCLLALGVARGLRRAARP